MCRDGFEGQFCEEEEEGVAAELVWFLVIGIIITLAVLIYFNAAQIRIKMRALGVQPDGDDGR